MNYETFMDEIILQAQQELTRLKNTTKLEEKIALSQIIKNLTDSFAGIVNSTSNLMNLFNGDFPDEDDWDYDDDI
jgi:hypothetical protein